MAERKKICKHCAYWERYSDAFNIKYHGPHAGECSCDKFTYSDDDSKVSRDGLQYWDYDGYSAGFETGELFGCVHFKKIKS
jgi:hypothetical protein